MNQRIFNWQAANIIYRICPSIQSSEERRKNFDAIYKALEGAGWSGNDAVTYTFSNKREYENRERLEQTFSDQGIALNLRGTFLTTKKVDEVCAYGEREIASGSDIGKLLK